MTAPRRGGGERRRGGGGSGRSAPRRDLGPAAHGGPSSGRSPPFDAWRAVDEFTREAIEIASIHAEERVQAYLASRTEPVFVGFSTVELHFVDAGTLASFRRTRAVSAVPGEDVWRLVRRWAAARGDGGLDEAMCEAVARHMNADFAGLLVARVVTWISRTP